MAKFLVVQSNPSWSEGELKKLAKDSKETQGAMGVTWKACYCAFNDKKFFSEWEAPNKESVVRILDAWQTPYEGVYQVKLMDGNKGDFKG